MGHNAGWLALGAGIASGADVILIPEIPYDPIEVARAIRKRQQRGNNFSIVVVAEGAMSQAEASSYHELKEKKQQAKKQKDKETKTKANAELNKFSRMRNGHTVRLSQELEEMTGLESRLTILGHLQRGGTPSAADRVLATRLGSSCIHYINEGVIGAMIAVKGEGTEVVPLQDVVGKRSVVPLDHTWLLSARQVGTCLGD